jgi:hypothetical protein
MACLHEGELLVSFVDYMNVRKLFTRLCVFGTRQKAVRKRIVLISGKSNHARVPNLDSGFFPINIFN